MAPSYRYPLRPINADMDYTKIEVIKYNAPGLGASNTNNPFAFNTTTAANSGRNKTVLGTLYLPIPSNLSDNNNAQWKDSRINSIALRAVAGLGNIVDAANIENVNSFKDLLNTAGATVEQIGNELDKFSSALDPAIRDRLKTALISEAVNVFGANIDANEIISRDSGQVLNPNLELIFRGVTLRDFTYNFDITPRTSAESLEVKNIINTLKKRSSPKSTAQGSSGGSRGIFIAAPEIFQVTFMKGGSPHPFLYTLKPTALVNMSVNYTGTGNYMTYGDGTPVKMVMTTRFTEVNPIFEEDYTGVEGVGF